MATTETIQVLSTINVKALRPIVGRLQQGVYLIPFNRSGNRRPYMGACLHDRTMAEQALQFW